MQDTSGTQTLPDMKGRNLTCIIIDDEPLAVKLLQSYVEKTPGLTLKATHNSALQALDFLTHDDADLIFCDIQMPDLNGLQFARIIGHMKSRIIFTTAYDQYAVESWDTNALYYLLKPIDYSNFIKAVSKAQQWFELTHQAGQLTGTNTQDTADNFKEEEDTPPVAILEDSFFVKSDYRLVRIQRNKILFIEGLRDYVRIHIEGRKTAIVSLMAIRHLENILPQRQFLRVHRSYIVNLDKIEAYERGQSPMRTKKPFKNTFRNVPYSRKGHDYGQRLPHFCPFLPTIHDFSAEIPHCIMILSYLCRKNYFTI